MFLLRKGLSPHKVRLAASRISLLVCRHSRIPKVAAFGAINNMQRRVSGHHSRRRILLLVMVGLIYPRVTWSFALGLHGSSVFMGAGLHRDVFGLVETFVTRLAFSRQFPTPFIVELRYSHDAYWTGFMHCTGS